MVGKHCPYSLSPWGPRGQSDAQPPSLPTPPAHFCSGKGVHGWDIFGSSTCYLLTFYRAGTVKHEPQGTGESFLKRNPHRPVSRSPQWEQYESLFLRAVPAVLSNASKILGDIWGQKWKGSLMEKQHYRILRKAAEIKSTLVVLGKVTSLQAN